MGDGAGVVAEGAVELLAVVVIVGVLLGVGFADVSVSSSASSSWWSAGNGDEKHRGQAAVTAARRGVATQVRHRGTAALARIGSAAGSSG